jgi:prolyl oligopeptidase
MPPIARVEPVREMLWGEAIVDPYRWMENPADRDWLPFMRGQAAYARYVLDALPGRRALLHRIAALSSAMTGADRVQLAGERIFYERRPPGADIHQLFVRHRLEGPERLLIDPGAVRRSGQHISLDWWAPSPTGRWVCYGLSRAGSEDSVMHFMNVDSRQVLRDRIDRTQYATPSWLPDETGVFYNRLAPGVARDSVDYFKNSACWLHRLGTPPEADIKVLGGSLEPGTAIDPIDAPNVAADASSEWVVAGLYGGVRRENPLFTARLADVAAGKARWRRVCDVADEVVSFVFKGDDLFLLTTRDAPNGRVVRTSMGQPDLSAATTVVAEGRAVIDGLVAARDALYVADMEGGYGNLRRVSHTGENASVSLPFRGAIGGLVGDTGQDGILLTLGSWLRPPSVWSFRPGGEMRPAALSPAPRINVAPYEVIESFATSADGTRIPVSIVAKKGMDRDGSHPTIVAAYGSYQEVMRPSFDGRAMAFLEQGGIVATAHVRGGGEYGKAWWQSGQKLTKPNTWRDLIAACEHLIGEGWTSRHRLAIDGASAGGIAVGMAMAERPDLLAAMIGRVGAFNLLRSEFAPNGPNNVVEFGSVADEAGFRALRAMDSFHAVQDGVAYPAVLLTVGMTDSRVSPWDPAKMAARLQRATTSANPVLLRVTFDEGHGIGSTKTQADEEAADVYAFVLSRTRARPSPGR